MFEVRDRFAAASMALAGSAVTLKGTVLSPGLHDVMMPVMGGQAFLQR